MPLAVLFRDVPGRHDWIVLEVDEVPALQGLLDERLLRRERVHRVQIEPHDPRIRQMRGRRDEIADERRAPARRFHPDHLMMHVVTARAADTHARHDRLIVVHQVQDAGVGERHEVVRPVAGAIPLVRVRRILPFAAPHDVSGAGETGRTRPEASRVVNPPA